MQHNGENKIEGSGKEPSKEGMKEINGKEEEDRWE